MLNARAAARALISGAATILFGLAHAIRELGRAPASVLRRPTKGGLPSALRPLATALSIPPRLAFDTTVTALVSIVSAVQILLRLESPARRLMDPEKAILAEVFGPPLDLDAIRVHERVGGLSGCSGRAFVIGNKIFVPRGASLDPPTLVHEATHVWQFQQSGLAYISESLIARYLGGEGYSLAALAGPGVGWLDLNPEQQASLLEIAWRAGYFDARGQDPLPALLVRAGSEAAPEGGLRYRVRLARGGHSRLTALADGFTDVTDRLEESVGLVALGRARPEGRLVPRLRRSGLGMRKGRSHGSGAGGA